MAKFNIPHSRQEVLSEGVSFTPPWSRFLHEIWLRIGADKIYGLGGLVASSGATAGNVGTGEDDLLAYSVEKNTLNDVGDVLEFKAFGTFADNTNTKSINVYFGSTLILGLTGTTSTFQAKEWSITTSIIRTGASAQRVVTDFSTFGVVFSEVTISTEDFTTALELKCTGEGTSDNDITQNGYIVKAFPVG